MARWVAANKKNAWADTYVIGKAFRRNTRARDRLSPADRPLAGWHFRGVHSLSSFQNARFLKN